MQFEGIVVRGLRLLVCALCVLAAAGTAASAQQAPAKVDREPAFAIEPVPLEFMRKILPDAMVGVRFHSSVQVMGGVFLQSLTVDGDLPPGLYAEIGGSTVTFLGVPEIAGEYDVEVTAEDWNGVRLTHTFPILVRPQILGASISRAVTVNDTETITTSDSPDVFFPVVLVDNETISMTDAVQDMDSVQIMVNEPIAVTDAIQDMDSVFIVDNETISVTDAISDFDSVFIVDNEAITVSDTVSASAMNEPPALTNPTPGSTLANQPTFNFTWTPGSPAAHYFELRISAIAAGDSEVYNSGELAGSVQSRTVAIPANGQKLYVRLYGWVGSAWSYTDYTFTEASTLPALISPVSSPLSGPTQFNWSTGAPAARYFALHFSTISPGGSDVYTSGQLAGTVQSETVNIPANAQKLYVRLYYWLNSAWQYKDYTFTEASAPPALTSPTTARLSGPTQFAWSAGAPAARYFKLVISTVAAGDSDFYNSGQFPGTVQSETLNIPSNGKKLYVRLYYWENSTWNFSDYTFTEGLS